MVRSSMCQCDVLFIVYLVTCLAGLCVVCLVHVLHTCSNRCVSHISLFHVPPDQYSTSKRGQVSTLKCAAFDPHPPTGTLALRGKPAVDKSVVKSKVSRHENEPQKR